eukprot:830373-Pelagomonas_calceolata.AAC.1
MQQEAVKFHVCAFGFAGMDQQGGCVHAGLAAGAGAGVMGFHHVPGSQILQPPLNPCPCQGCTEGHSALLPIP